MIYILFLEFIRLPDYNYADRFWTKKGRKNYGIYVSTTGSEKMGHFRKAGTDTLRGEPHTGRIKTWLYVADTKGRKKARRRTKKKQY